MKRDAVLNSALSSHHHMLFISPSIFKCIHTYTIIHRGSHCPCKIMSSSSRRVTKKVALERLRNARRKREMGELDAERDVLEGNNFREEEDVYDVVDEEEYRSLVESRRQREDFVVDDGRLWF
jgi:hypothetical protein